MCIASVFDPIESKDIIWVLRRQQTRMHLLIRSRRIFRRNAHWNYIVNDDIGIIAAENPIASREN